MKQDNRMKRILRIVAFLTGIAILAVSIYWSQDGFNFNMAGDAGYGDIALIIGLVLAFSVTVIQFVFSSDYVELNPSLIVLGFLAYGYSIYTNFQGITHFQGGQPNKIAAWVLGFCMDAAPEPLIAWSLGASRSGDFLGNMIMAVINVIKNFFTGILGEEKSSSKSQQQPTKQFTFTPDQTHQDTKPRMPVPAFRPPQSQNNPNKKKSGEGGRFTGFFGE